MRHDIKHDRIQSYKLLEIPNPHDSNWEMELSMISSGDSTVFNVEPFNDFPDMVFDTLKEAKSYLKKIISEYKKGEQPKSYRQEESSKYEEHL